MESNPYAAPAAVVEDVGGGHADDLESRKAGRGKRLGAAVIDGLTNLPWAGLFVWAFEMRISATREQLPMPQTSGMLIFLGFLLMLGLFVVNCVMIHRSGQTIGKRVLDMAVVRSDGSPITLLRYIFLRVVPVALLAAIPLVGRFVGLIDPLLIFGKERRCLHDLIADTIVVDV
ncbi:RDD family protein [Rhodanobacter aciditrophus]|uniref:RDD family protein n=1 Tax=Rhodanobacter aciditrophus TaxID=1623218 RepID=UPI003CF35F32